MISITVQALCLPRSMLIATSSAASVLDCEILEDRRCDMSVCIPRAGAVFSVEEGPSGSTCCCHLQGRGNRKAGGASSSAP